MIMALVSNILVLCALAALSAVILYATSKRYAVDGNPQADEIFEVLPHANCGACGYAGCRDFADKCAKAEADEFAKMLCPVGGNKVMRMIAEIKGVSAVNKDRTCAVLRCNGTCQNAPDKTAYTGQKSCRVAAMVMSGSSGCPDGCLRFGDCVQVCKFGALSLDEKTGLPVIDYLKCTSCGACVKRCPRGLFEIRPIKDEAQVYVACRNRQKGAVARKNCTAACIACGKCAKINPQIKVENNLAYIPTGVSAREFGEELAKACPVKAIQYRAGMIEEAEYED